MSPRRAVYEPNRISGIFEIYAIKVLVFWNNFISFDKVTEQTNLKCTQAVGFNQKISHVSVAFEVFHKSETF